MPEVVRQKRPQGIGSRSDRVSQESWVLLLFRVVNTLEAIQADIEPPVPIGVLTHIGERHIILYHGGGPDEGHCIIILWGDSSFFLVRCL